MIFLSLNGYLDDPLSNLSDILYKTLDEFVADKGSI